MLTPTQQWLATPTDTGLAQKTYHSMQGLQESSHVQRLEQATHLWTSRIWMTGYVSIRSWAMLYASKSAFILHPKNPGSKHILKSQDPMDQWLQLNQKPTARLFPVMMEVIKSLGPDSALSHVAIQRYCIPTKQIDLYRSVFPGDIYHDKMGLALDINVIKLQNIDGYLRVRKSLALKPTDILALPDILDLDLDFQGL